ncbi:hypothetical protein TKK_0006970 [Trichogramma kaykai]|uniref:Uncharacterized protein n=1 Tax=Trichogramma kaykai TaxID=54128 RepID=A0ABD2XBI4_9HYME
MKIPLMCFVLIGVVFSVPVKKQLSTEEKIAGLLELPSLLNFKISKVELITFISIMIKLLVYEMNLTIKNSNHDNTNSQDIEKLQNAIDILNHAMKELKREKNRFKNTIMHKKRDTSTQNFQKNILTTPSYRHSPHNKTKLEPIAILNESGELDHNLDQLYKDVVNWLKNDPKLYAASAKNQNHSGEVTIPIEAAVVFKQEDTLSRQKRSKNQQQKYQQREGSNNIRKRKEDFDLTTMSDEEVTTRRPAKMKVSKTKSKKSEKSPPSLINTLVKTFLIPDKNNVMPDIANIITQVGKKYLKSNFTQLTVDENVGKDISEPVLNDEENEEDEDISNKPKPNKKKRKTKSLKSSQTLTTFSTTMVLVLIKIINQGSLGSLADLIPLLIPILEDISDPESDTDLGEILSAAVPLIQGLLEPDPESGVAGPDIVGIALPLLQTLLLGKDGMGSDSGAFLGPLVQIIGPIIGPVLGPLVGPLSSAYSGDGPRAFPLGKILASFLGYFSEERDGMSIIASLTSSTVAILSKELSGPDSEIDVGKLVSQVITGASSGFSAGASGESSAGLSNGPGGGYPPAVYGPPSTAQIALIEPPKQNQPAPATFNNSNKKRTSKRKSINAFRPQSPRPKPTPRPSLDDYDSAEAQNYGAYGPPAGGGSGEGFTKAFQKIIASGVNLLSAFLGLSSTSSGTSADTTGSYGQAMYGPPAPYQG